MIRTRATKSLDYCTQYVMKRKGSALDYTATGSCIAAGTFDYLNSRRWYTYTVYFTLGYI